MNKISIEIQSYHFVALADWVHFIEKSINQTNPAFHGDLPQYFWTIYVQKSKFSFDKINRWRQKNNQKTYKLSLEIDFCLAYMYNISVYPHYIYVHQDIKNQIFKALLNRGFAPEHFQPASYQIVSDYQKPDIQTY